MTPEEKRKYHADYMRERYRNATPEQREARRTRMRDWRAKQREHLRAYQAAWEAANREHRAEYADAYYAKNCDRIREHAREYQAQHAEARAKSVKRFRDKPENLVYYMLSHAKCRAKKRGLEWDDRLRDVFKNPPLVCPCCGSTLKYGQRVGHGFVSRSPSLDRMDNRKGYTLENTRVLCWRCNHLKNDATVEELEKIVAYMRHG